jgi:hypothetical protein
MVAASGPPPDANLKQYSNAKTNHLLPLNKLLFYRWYDRSNEHLKYVYYLVVTIFAAYESYISVALLSVSGHPFYAFILRSFLRFILPLFLWSALERASWQFLCCYHSHCAGMSVSNREVSFCTQQIELLKELGPTVLYVALSVLYTTRFGIPEQDLFDNAFPANSTMVSKSLAETVEILSLPVLVGQIQMTVSLISFEDRFANHCSCPDTMIKRWSSLKGTIVVMTLGLSTSAFLQFMTSSHERDREVIPDIPWTALLVGLLVFCSTHKRWQIRMGAFVVWMSGLLLAPSVQARMLSSNTFQSAVHYAAAGMIASWICAGKNLYQWSNQFRGILKHSLALGCLAVLASDVNNS